ncbi:MAG: hypothetical protein ACKVOH_06050 [Chlamydiales bacterium]
MSIQPIRISTPFDSHASQEAYYIQAIRKVLLHIFPPHLLEGEDAFYYLENQLPIVCWTPLGTPPFNISFFLLSRSREGGYRYFCEMISRWLVPGRRLTLLMQSACDFTLPDISPELYTSGEVIISIQTKKDLEVVQKNLPIIESEIRLGVSSAYQASRIVEIKGLTHDEKVALVQENIVSLVKHRPDEFDYDILSEMQHFLILCKQEFKQARSYRHISRLICVLYLFRKTLALTSESFPHRRYINVKLVRAKLGEEKVLGIVLALSFLDNNEILEAKHVLNAINILIPKVSLVEGSFILNQGRSERIVTLYLEVERKGRPITLEEEKRLKEHLSTELKNRIERRLNPIFMPQNEEEIMRYIVTLSGQLKYVRDLPQVIINFTQQTEEKLEFLVILVRIEKENAIVDLFTQKATFLEFCPDRVKDVGKIRKRYPKEANVFRLRILKRPFLRQDHSVDLYKARQEVTKELGRVIGEFRDYNGGTLSKESELFNRLRELLEEKGQENDFLLEEFFYNLKPAVMRSLLPPELLQKLFLMLLELMQVGLNEGEHYLMRFSESAKDLYIMIEGSDPGFHDFLFTKVELHSFDIATCFLQNIHYPCLGIVYRNPNLEEALAFRLDIEQAMSEWSEQMVALLT